MKKECAVCGAIGELPDKPEPITAKEGRQVLFNCRVCGAVNYRDGSAVPHGQRTVKHGQIPDEPLEEIKDEPKERTGGIAGILTVFSILVASIAAAFFLRRHKVKLEEKSSEKPKDPFGPVH